VVVMIMMQLRLVGLVVVRQQRLVMVVEVLQQ